MTTPRTTSYSRLGLALGTLALTCAAASAAPLVAATPAPGCVASLRDVHTGSGVKSFASHYVTFDSYGYGEFSAGGFGGQSLWKKRGTLWCRVATGAAILDRPTLIGFGVQPAVVDRLLAQMKSQPELAPPKPLPTLAPFVPSHPHR
ncbi:MAG: hypothetical protein IAI49_16110 [Candidatus Eremiobacteraeota bacterium]|nr:hypothetical protein [Candidatus Eremiobacteraeota bacterium]